MVLQMKLHQLIVEMTPPQSIGPTDFDLTVPSENEKMAAKLGMDKSNQELKQLDSDRTLYKSGSYYYVLDKSRTESKMIYMIRTEVNHLPVVKEQAITQNRLWRETLAITVPYAKMVFFNYLLKDYHLIATDTQQTEDGEIFWNRRVTDGFDLGHHVYFLDIMAPRKLVKLTSAAKFDRFNHDKKIWGSEQKFKTRKILISDHELSSQDPKVELEVF